MVSIKLLKHKNVYSLETCLSVICLPGSQLEYEI